MNTFFVDIFHYDFLWRALLASFLASISCGLLGTYVVTKRSSYMVGAISHSLLGGIGLARYCQVVLGLSFFTPMLGAIFASLLIATLVTLLSTHTRFREDTVLSSIWTLGIAIGLCFISALPGYAEDLNSYIFGNILLISPQDILTMLILDIVILCVSGLFHNRFIVLCFHQEGLLLRGLSPTCTALLLNMLIALAVVQLTQTVGIILVLALMVLPPATALLISRHLHHVMFLGGLLCFLECLIGMMLSYGPNWPTGPVIIILSVSVYLITAFVHHLINRRS